MNMRTKEPIATTTCVQTGTVAKSCAACGAGKYSSSTDHICELCPPGKYSAALSVTSSSTCKDCEAGTFSGYGATECTVATANAVVTSDRSGQVCAAGYKRVCSDASSTATVSGSLFGNGQYTRQTSKVNNKPMFSVVPDEGQTRAEYQLKFGTHICMPPL